MSNKKEHEWNILIVEKLGFPRPQSKEFKVKSATLLGAAMKANAEIKNHHQSHIVQSIWWLDPNRAKRDLR